MLRFFDILFSGVAIIILFPFMFPIMAILKLTGEHDTFYTQERVGKNGKIFRVIKFATMLRDSPNMQGGLITAPNDPRLLPIGKILRKTKINELPQLFNIFIGDMSIVGYRPFAVKHYELYSEEVQQHINTIRPGITGIGSIVFRNEEEILHSVDDRDYVHDKLITPYKGKLECWYVQNRTVKNYFLLIFFTVLIVLHSESTLWKKAFKNLPEPSDELKQYLS